MPRTFTVFYLVIVSICSCISPQTETDPKEMHQDITFDKNIEFEYVFADTFTTYGNTLELDQVWHTDSFVCQLEQNSLKSTEKYKSFSYPLNSPIGTQVVAKAIIIANTSIKKEWKITGVAILKDHKNYWQLALVEKPDADGKGHFVELSEMLNAEWCAQYNENTRLTPLINQQSFNWKYNTPYEFHLVLTGSEIKGYVFDASGILKAELGYVLDNHAVASGRPAFVSEGFSARCLSFEAKAAGNQCAMRVWPTYSNSIWGWALPNINGLLRKPHGQGSPTCFILILNAIA